MFRCMHRHARNQSLHTAVGVAACLTCRRPDGLADGGVGGQARHRRHAPAAQTQHEQRRRPLAGI